MPQLLRRLMRATALAATLLPAFVIAQSDVPYRSVDPFIGTQGNGHTFPGAVVPFGMVQLSPDTQTRYFKESYPWAAGYQYNDPTILGFSHTHFSGSGHSDLGDVLVTPISGDVRLEPGDMQQPRSGYRSRFSHDTERAEPGYYAVTLSDYDVRAELTATTRVGLHRYTFPAGQPAHVLVDLRSSIYDYPGKVLWSRIRVRPDGTVTGFRETRGWARGRQLYFAMRFSAPSSAHAFHNRETKPEYDPNFVPWFSRTDIDYREGRGLVAVFDFAGLESSQLLVKVALSPVSEENALRNLDAEVPNWDFDAKRAAAADAWRGALGVADIEAPEPMRKMLYTALYHSLMAPSVFMDVDGSYRGPDLGVHRADGFTFRSTFSLWDTYRALHPLLTLVRPQADNDEFVRSLLASYRTSPDGLLPVWQYHGQETWTMIGYHAVPVIADAYLKGIRGFPADEALEAMVASASKERYAGLGDYIRTGWVPSDKEREGASKTLEYAYDDWTIARMAESLGRKDIAQQFDRRAGYWRNVFDRKTGFVRARKSDGGFREPFDPAVAGYGGDYTEGNAWQYTWYVPHDTAGLIELMGGNRRFIAKLDELFDAKVDAKSFEHVEDISGLIGYYAHGNEPSHHVAYLYAYAGEPWRTQERLKQIVETQYHASPEGLSGNDDLGQMSAWLFFTAMGFYPVTPGSGEYVIGRPFVDRMALNLPNGRRFTIVTEGLSDANRYIGSVSLNGEPLPRVFLRHEEIMQGGELRFVMQARPNKQWATKASARPYSVRRSG
ncbi:putative alpha-1,2-mannosidase [Povalibacter uvarum]|uniref:Putative alpha-1,2-mannosidase n=1 Tax=Povalibacter uvarum TaxID=732238 RepID=A0A841HIF4_9GAMM|nr:GH92 family glycosyl hydrolase [Povalibacter uvarum]MBB6092493.1 putative alpha-1,2-mannosidase [Povalibacter uvarum]